MTGNGSFQEGLKMIKDLKGLMDSAVSSESVTISVAAADENETLHAVAEASRMGLAKSILVGNQEWIEVILKKLGIQKGTFEIIHEKDSVKAAALAAQVVREGRADILMKGGVVTSKFLQAALGSPGGLKGGLFSDVEVYEDVEIRFPTCPGERRRGEHIPRYKAEARDYQECRGGCPSSGHEEPEGGSPVRIRKGAS